MNLTVNKANLTRVAIHIGLAAAGAAVAAAGLDLSHSSNPQVVSAAALLTTWAGSFIRQEQAVNDSGGTPSLEDAVAVIKAHYDQRKIIDAVVGAALATATPAPAPASLPPAA